MKGKSDASARAIQLAKQDTQRALEVAGSIAEGWSRAQALAWIGRFAPDADVSTILGEARESSLAANTPFKTVDSSAWWIRAMIERGDIEGATEWARRYASVFGEGDFYLELQDQGITTDTLLGATTTDAGGQYNLAYDPAATGSSDQAAEGEESHNFRGIFLERRRNMDLSLGI
jgi:hypothetical protein